MRVSLMKRLKFSRGYQRGNFILSIVTYEEQKIDKRDGTRSRASGIFFTFISILFLIKPNCRSFRHDTSNIEGARRLDNKTPTSEPAQSDPTGTF